MTMLLIGCASVPANEAPAICETTATTRTALAGALVSDGGTDSRRQGASLIAQLDAACE